MGYYGKTWLIDGIVASVIETGQALGAGEYRVWFERENATLEQIEGINWAKPTVEYIGPHGSEPGLPEGYGFKITNVRYDYNGKTYIVTVKTAQQYLGDVSQYQNKITELEAAAVESKEKLAAATAQLEELEAAYDDN